MSRHKYVFHKGGFIGVLDSSHDIAVAVLVEQIRAAEVSEELEVEAESWAVCASVGDLAISIPSDWLPGSLGQLAEAVSSARKIVESHGDYCVSDLEEWSLVPDTAVAGGWLRGGFIRVAQVLDVYDGLEVLLSDRGELADLGSFGYWPAG